MNIISILPKRSGSRELSELRHDHAADGHRVAEGLGLIKTGLPDVRVHHEDHLAARRTTRSHTPGELFPLRALKGLHPEVAKTMLSI